MHKLNRKMKPSKVVSGIFLMVIHAIAVSILYVASKQLTTSMHPHQVAFLYKFAILIAILPWCYAGGIRKNLSTKRLGVHVARGTFSIMGSLCFFYALAKVDVLDAAAITYLENILVVLIGFAFFKEKMNFSKVLFLICGFIGAVLITKPGFQEFNKYYIYIFLALLFWAGNNITIKVLGKTEHSKAQLFYVTLFSSLISFPLALQQWSTLELWHCKYLAVLAICYLAHTSAFFKALKFAEISTVMPFDYTRLIFTGILGYIFFSEVPDKFSFVGYTLICIGGIYLIQHQARLKFKKKEFEKADI